MHEERGLERERIFAGRPLEWVLEFLVLFQFPKFFKCGFLVLEYQWAVIC